MLELQDNITSEFLKSYPEYRWMNNSLRISRGYVAEIIDLSVTERPAIEAPSIWILIHPDFPNTIIQTFLRNLFSREISNCPLGCPLIFMPESFQASKKE
jgi:hypothetical protein